MADDLRTFGVCLVFRSEGKSVNAYMANERDMKDPVLLGSVHRTMVESRVDFWDRWKGLMTEMFRQVVAETFDMDPDDVAMPERPAPEHERSGHG